MWKEFKEFSVQGNMIDLAVGVIIGGAFGNIVTSLVHDIMMPLIGMLLGNIDFSKLSLSLGNGSTLEYGLFINNVVDFLIVSLSIFIVIKQLNKFKKKEEDIVTEKTCEYCYSEIHIDASRCPNCTSEL